MVRKLKLEHDSFDNPGKSIGDDVCSKVVKLKIKKLPPNKRFKKGIPVSLSIKNVVNTIQSQVIIETINFV